MAVTLRLGAIKWPIAASLVGWVEERNPTFKGVDKRQHDLHTGTKPIGFRGAQPNLRNYNNGMAF